MIAGVSFDDQHCYDDLGMILAQKEIGLPETQTTYVEVPGRDGVIDLTEAASGTVKYNSREITLTFITCKNISELEWPQFLERVAGALHGQKKKITFDEDEDYYYSGRCEIDTFETSNAKQTVVVRCTCDPYKYYKYASGEAWLWDPFSFVDGVIYNTSDVYINTPDSWTDVDVWGYAYNPTMTIVSTAEMTVFFNGVEYTITEGANVMYDIILVPGDNHLYFKGKGTITIVRDGGEI